MIPSRLSESLVIALSSHDDAFSPGCLATIAVFMLIKGVLLLLRWHCKCSDSRENGSSCDMRLERGLVNAAF